MTSAVIAAEALDLCLRTQRRSRPNGDLAGVARRFQRLLARRTGEPWRFSTSEDLRYPTTTGDRRGLIMRAQHRYLGRLEAATTYDPAVADVYIRALGMLEPPTVLLRPRIVAASVRARPTTAETPCRPACRHDRRPHRGASRAGQWAGPATVGGMYVETVVQINDRDTYQASVRLRSAVVANRPPLDALVRFSPQLADHEAADRRAGAGRLRRRGLRRHESGAGPGLRRRLARRVGELEVGLVQLLDVDVLERQHPHVAHEPRRPVMSQTQASESFSSK